jgi:hypothetical protein
MMTTITDTQARALAALVHALRPDWDVPGIRKALWDARRKGSAVELTHAAVEAAVNPDARTPAVIALDGAHWTVARPWEDAAPAHVERCPQPGHTSYPAWSCGACRAEQIGADEPRPIEPLVDLETYTRGAALARAALLARDEESA